MDSRHSDGLLAGGGLVALLVAAVTADAIGAVVDPRTAVAGVGVAALLEVAFLRYPDRLRSLWERSGVPLVSLLVVLAVGGVAVRAAPAVLGVLVWGLATYLVLLSLVLAGLGNPLAPVARVGGRE